MVVHEEHVHGGWASSMPAQVGTRKGFLIKQKRRTMTGKAIWTSTPQKHRTIQKPFLTLTRKNRPGTEPTTRRGTGPPPKSFLGFCLFIYVIREHSCRPFQFYYIYPRKNLYKTTNRKKNCKKRHLHTCKDLHLLVL